MLSEDVLSGKTGVALAADFYISAKGIDFPMVVSPLTLQLMLAMISYIANNRTSQMIGQKLLRSESYTDQDMSDYLGRLFATCKGTSRYGYFKCYTEMTRNPQVDIDYELLAKLKQNVYPRFVPAEHVQCVKAMITAQIHSSGDVSTNKTEYDVDEYHLGLATAIIFRSLWLMPFPTDDLTQELFHHAVGDPEMKTVMNKVGKFNYSGFADADVVTIRYERNAISIAVILPKSKFGYKKITRSLNADNLMAFLEPGEEKEVNVTIPVFKIEGVKDVRKIFKRMGFKKLLQPKSLQQHLYVKSINHDINFEITEFGSVYDSEEEDDLPAPHPEQFAVAASRKKRDDEQPIQFLANHPFLFAIFDTEYKNILFLGRYS